MRIEATTRVAGVMGHPVEHSLSPRFQNMFVEETGVDAVYVAFPCPPERLSEALAGLHAAGVHGLNLTVPHKEAALALVAPDALAARIGAVNTLVRTDEGWRGTNTDAEGVRAAARALGFAPGEHVLVFGAGGAARAAAWALAEAGAARVALCNRTPERAEALARALGAQGWEAGVVPWEPAAVRRACAQSAGIVQATSLGLRGEPFPFALAGEGWALDLVYTPAGETDFVRKAGLSGRRAEDGLRMLVHQGAASFAHWFGVRPDAERAFRALADGLGRRLEAAA